MDPRQIYRLADTLNPLGYPQRVTILNICLRDNQYHRSRIEAELDMMYQRRWLIERSKIRYVHQQFGLSINLPPLPHPPSPSAASPSLSFPHFSTSQGTPKHISHANNNQS